MKLFSVVIPCYNAASFIRSAVDSVLNQTFRNYEVIIVDDGSTDNTKEQLNGYIKKRLIRYYRIKNQGVSFATNYGIKKAKGRYIAFLDHDDLWPPEHLEIVIKHLEQNKDYDIAYTRIIVQNSDGSRRELGSSERFKSGWLTKEFFCSSPCMLPSATCFRSMASAIANGL